MSANVRVNMGFNLKQSFIFWIESVVLPKLGYFSSKQISLGRVNTSQPYSICTEKILIVNGSGDIESSIVVKSNGSVVPSTSYSINYVTNEIIFKSILNAITIDFKVLNVEVREAYPEGVDFNSIKYPIVAMDITDSQPQKDFAIGSSESFWAFTYFIDIFAPDDNTRRSLKDGIQFIMNNEWLPLINFADGMLIKNDGSINTNFSLDSQFLYPIKDLGKPRGRIFYDNLFSDKMKYRASIDGLITIIF